ncbi:MAG: tape measure protein [Desulfoprunum sp.]|nr:tape measure protein [Desulfoprunum sp.]
MSDYKQTYTLQAKYEGKGELGQFNRDLAALGKIDAFSKLEAQISKTETALEEAEKKAAALKAAMEKGATGKAAADYSRAEAEVKKLSTALEMQNAKLEQHAASLKKSGVDIRNLSIEEKRLATTAEQTGKVLSARQILGVKSTKEIKAEVEKLRGAYETLRKSGTSNAKDIATAQVALKRRIAEVRGETSGLDNNFRKLGYTILGALSIRAAIYYANQVRQIADQYQNMNARLKLVTDSSEDFKNVQAELYKTSQDTGTEYAANANSYAKLAVSLKGVGAKSEEVLKINELVNKSLIVNGSSTEEASSFMLQFAQAMGSGVLQGDEFRAMMESNGYFAQLLAKELGTDIAGLRQMSKAGELTSDVLRAAFPKMAKEINAAFSTIPPTTQRALTSLQNAFYRIIDDSNKSSNATGRISAEIIGLAQTIDQNREGIVFLFTEMINKAGWAANKIGEIGSVIAGTKAILSGDLGFKEALSFKTAAELNVWLKANIKEIKATSVSYNENATAASGSYNKVTAAATSSADKQKKVTGEALDKMKEDYKKYADDVKNLQDDMARRQQSVAERLREMDRSGMSDSSAWNDRKAQAEEYAAAAKKVAEESKRAFAAGDQTTGKSKAEEAVALLDKAGEAAADLNREVSNGDTVISTQGQNLAIARGMVQEYATTVKQVQTELKSALEQGAQALDIKSGGQLSKELPEIAKAFGDLKDTAVKEVGIINEEIKLVGGVWVNVNTTAKEESDKSTAHQIANIKRVAAAAAAIETTTSTSGGGSGGGYRLGGLVSEVRMAMGGPVGPAVKMATGGNVFRNMLSGGWFPGYGGGDRRHVIAEDGEYMFDKHRVKDAGLNTVRAFHAGRYDIVIAELMKRMRMNTMESVFSRIPTMQSAGPQYMQNGGEVTGGGTSHYNLTVNFSGNTSAPVQQTGRQLAETVLRELKAMHRRSS